MAGKLIRGIDIREHGSGNLGATNVARVLGAKFGIAVLILDAFKGFAAPFFLPTLFSMMGEPPAGFIPWMPAALAMAAICGHNWPVYLGFKGGKGVAASLGALLAISPFVVLIGLAAFLATALVSRMISLGSVVAAVAVAVGTWLTTASTNDLQSDLLISLIAVLVVVRHKANIRRILNGTEPKFGDKAGKIEPSGNSSPEGNTPDA
jgi:glycerol-3-phosphate acyltransferase PlsY